MRGIFPDFQAALAREWSPDSLGLDCSLLLACWELTAPAVSTGHCRPPEAPHLKVKTYVLVKRKECLCLGFEESVCGAGQRIRD